MVKTAHKVRLVEAVAQRSYTILITEQRAFTPFDFMKIYVKFLSINGKLNDDLKEELFADDYAKLKLETATFLQDKRVGPLINAVLNSVCAP